MKPGIRSTEFWLTLATTGVALVAVLFGLTPSESQELTVALEKAIIAASSLVASAAVVWRYIASRQYLKTLATIASQEDAPEEDAPEAVPPAPVEPPLPPGGKIVEIPE